MSRDETVVRDIAAFIRRLEAFRDAHRDLYSDGLFLPMSDCSSELEAAGDAIERAIRAAQQRYGEECLRGDVVEQRSGNRYLWAHDEAPR